MLNGPTIYLSPAHSLPLDKIIYIQLCKWI